MEKEYATRSRFTVVDISSSFSADPPVYNLSLLFHLSIKKSERLLVSVQLLGFGNTNSICNIWERLQSQVNKRVVALRLQKRTEVHIWVCKNDSWLHILEYKSFYQFLNNIMLGHKNAFVLVITFYVVIPVNRVGDSEWI